MNLQFTASPDLNDAMHLRAAELWLEVGEPNKALTELQKLTVNAWSCSWTAEVLHDLEIALLTKLSHLHPTESTEFWTVHHDDWLRAA
jgi:hypothetical protein